MESSPQAVNWVVIGGGTGSLAVLSALRRYSDNLTALVNMADDGGSTGQLRNEYGVLPPGDVRQCLVALSNLPQARELFDYRFSEGSLQGHAFGNLFLAAAEKATGSFEEGVELAAAMMNVSGRVLPITADRVDLSMTLQDGTEVTGEYAVSIHDVHHEKPELCLCPRGSATPQALRSITEADVVVIAPGHLYGSLAPALLVDGIGDALAQTQAPVVYVSNLVTKPHQTDGFTVTDFADEIERLAGRKVLDYVVYNDRQPDEAFMKHYADAGEIAVDIGDVTARHWKAVGADLLSDQVRLPRDGDPIKRTVIRHDPDKTARALVRLHLDV